MSSWLDRPLRVVLILLGLAYAATTLLDGLRVLMPTLVIFFTILAAFRVVVVMFRRWLRL